MCLSSLNDLAGAPLSCPAGGLVSGDMAMERERRAWEAEVEGNLAQETAQAARRQEKKEVSRRVDGWAASPLFGGSCLDRSRGLGALSPAPYRVRAWLALTGLGALGPTPRRCS